MIGVSSTWKSSVLPVPAATRSAVSACQVGDRFSAVEYTVDPTCDPPEVYSRSLSLAWPVLDAERTHTE